MSHVYAKASVCVLLLFISSFVLHATADEKAAEDTPFKSRILSGIFTRLSSAIDKFAEGVRASETAAYKQLERLRAQHAKAP